MYTITVNGGKLLYSQDSNFTNATEIVIDPKTGNVKNLIQTDIPANSYIKFVFNCTNKTSNTKYLQFNGVSFYGEAGGEEGGEDVPGGDNPGGGDTGSFEDVLSDINVMLVSTYADEEYGNVLLAMELYGMDFISGELSSDASIYTATAISDKNYINGTHELFPSEEAFGFYLGEDFYPFASGTVTFSCLQKETDEVNAYYAATFNCTLTDGNPFVYTLSTLVTLAIDGDLSDFETDEYVYYILQDEPIATKANALSYYPSIKTRPMPRKSPAFEHVMLRR